MKSLSRRLIGQLSHAKVLVVLGIFVILGGVSYAAVKLPADSDKTEQQGNGQTAASKTNSGSSTGQGGSASANGGVVTNGSQGSNGPSSKGAPDEPQILSNRKSNTLQTISLPAGKYLITSSGQIANDLAPYKRKRQTECSLLQGSKVLVSADAFNGAYDPNDPEGSSASIESIAMESNVKLTGTTTISLKCEPQDGRTSASMSLISKRER